MAFLSARTIAVGRVRESALLQAAGQVVDAFCFFFGRGRAGLLGERIPDVLFGFVSSFGQAFLSVRGFSCIFSFFGFLSL